MRVKNRAPAPIQITAEQLLREAHDRSAGQGGAKQPKTQITDPDELREFRMNKRKGFEVGCCCGSPNVGDGRGREERARPLSRSPRSG